MNELWVVKLGSSLITQHGRCLDRDWIAQMAAQISQLHSRGIGAVVVSSGAVAAGLQALQMDGRPEELEELQGAAAVGQPLVMQAWSQALRDNGLRVAQILLSHDDARLRERYLNLRAMVRRLVEYGVIPIINENDSVCTDEIKFGDNDRLAAMVADLAGAQRLVLATDQWGLLTADPRKDPTARRITRADAGDARLDAMAGDGGKLGQGGMRTKLDAARRSARSGVNTWIVHGRQPNLLPGLVDGVVPGTELLAPTGDGVWNARRRWLGTALHVEGDVIIDAGAAKVLRTGEASLLPVGVVDVRGEFLSGDLVRCLDPDGHEVARGLINYAAADMLRLCGAKGHEIEARLGREGDAEVIHRDNLLISGGDLG